MLTASRETAVAVTTLDPVAAQRHGNARPRQDDAILPMTLFGCPVSEFADPWRVCNVKCREEKAFVEDLRERLLPYFVPWEIVKTRDTVHRRTTTVQRPLFTGYVFVSGDDAMDAAVRCRGYRSRVPVSDAEQPRLRRELDHLYQVLKLDPVITKPIGIGSIVEIRSGPFQGMSGPVIAHANGMQLVLQVTMLGQSIAVEIDPSSVELAA